MYLICFLWQFSNNRHFILEFSETGLNIFEILFIFLNNIDLQPVIGINYFRFSHDCFLFELVGEPSLKIITFCYIISAIISMTNIIGKKICFSSKTITHPILFATKLKRQCKAYFCQKKN